MLFYALALSVARGCANLTCDWKLMQTTDAPYFSIWISVMFKWTSAVIWECFLNQRTEQCTQAFYVPAPSVSASWKQVLMVLIQFSEEALHLIISPTWMQTVDLLNLPYKTLCFPSN